jgi:hypothetical protein
MSVFLQNLRRRLYSPAFLTPLALALIAALAVVFRLSDLAVRDLWTDEAWVALAALKATPGAALAAGQSTPPLYLLSIWTAAQFLGGQEWVLRSLSFAFGVGALLILWLLARRLTSRSVSLLALAAAAVSPVLVYYSKELKQYSGDAFFAVLVFYLAERLRAGGGRGAWAALAAAGVVGLGFSHTLIFCLPAVGLILWLSLPGARGRLALLGGLWVLAFGAFYFLFFRHGMDPELVGYWAQDYPDFSGLWPFGLWLGSALHRYFWYFLGEWGVIWGPPLVLAGGYALWRAGSGRALVFFGGPILLALGAAALHRYPFMAHYGGNRLMLFTAPLLYLVAAVGLMSILTRFWDKRQRVLALALAGLLLLALNPRELIKENLYPANNREEIQPLVAHLQSQLQPQDWVYVYYFAVSPFKYYFPSPSQKVCWGKSCAETDLALPAAKSQHPRRLWLIASHFPTLGEMREFAGELLGPQWRETDCLSRVGAALLCFEWVGPQLAKSPTSPVRPGESGSPAPPADKAYR